MSATPDSTFANPEQRVADLERQLAEREGELAERTAERDEALEQQTATAEVLGRTNSSPGDLAPGSDVILERAMWLCEAAFGTMNIVDGGEGRFVAFKGVPEAFAEFRRQHPISANYPGSMSARVRAGEPFVHVLDVKDDD